MYWNGIGTGVDVNSVQENTLKTLKQETVIYLDHTQFGRFIRIFNKVKCKPSEQLSKAAQRLDNEGF